uniref:Uncharacterized protein n=1 Tax=Glossina pallidipes TaxID=7398 RepID=A0A1B0A319_GLOPL
MQQINFKSKSFNCVSNSASSTIYSRSPWLRQQLPVDARLQADGNPPSDLNQSDEIETQLRNECVGYQQLGSNSDSQEYQTLQSLEEYVSLPSTIPTIPSTDSHSRCSNSNNNSAQESASSALNLRLGETLTCYASASSNILTVLKSPTNIRTSSGLQVSENCPWLHDTCDTCLINASPLDEVSLNCCEKYLNYDHLTDDIKKICLHINKIFSEHFQDVNSDAKNKSELKQTFEDSVAINLEKLEAEVTERLERLRRKINIDHRPAKKDELLNFRKNINSFIKVTSHEKKFDVQDLSFDGKSHKRMFDLIDADMQTNSETHMYVLSDSWIQERPHSRIFGVNDSKLDVAPVKMSRRQDEIEELKKQLARMEMEMQRKFQHNNQLMQGLRDDLNNAVFKLTKSDLHAFLLRILKFLSGKF